MSRIVVVGLCFALALLTPTIQAVVDPVCDVECAPGPGSSGSGYGAIVRSRPTPQNARGRNPNQPIMGSESYNHAIPILNLPGRNGLDLNLTLYYNSRVWIVDNVNIPRRATFNADRDFPSYGFRLDFGYLEYDLESGTMFVLTEGNGTKHKLVNTTGTLWNSDDSSYIQFDFASRKLSYKNGTYVLYEPFASQASWSVPGLLRPIKIGDTNGNFISITYVANKDQVINTITDTLNRVITYQYDASGKLTNIKQGSKNYATFTWISLQLKYAFSGLTIIGSPGSTNPINLLSECIYPNSTKYHFTYGANDTQADWGIVYKIENKSSSGAVRSSVSYNFPLVAAGSLSEAPSYTQSVITTDGVDQTFNHLVSKSGTLVSTYQVTGPNNTVTKTTLFATAGDWKAGLVQFVDVFDGSTQLRRIESEWNSDPNTNANARVFRIKATLFDVNPTLTSKVEYRYDGEASINDPAASPTGNVVEMNEYDFYSGQQTPVLKRQTLTAFNTGLTNHILDRPSQILVKDGAGATVARTEFSYDAATPGFLETPGGVANHDDSFSGSRGNVTNITRFANAANGTGPISRDFQYDWFGNLRVAQLDCCNQKQWTYTSTTKFAYPTTIKRGPVGTQLTTSATFDNVTGIMLTSTDENGKVTTFHPDPVTDRITSIDQPSGVATPATLTTTIAFDDAAVRPAVTRSNSFNAVRQVTTTDGLGRVLFQDTCNAATCSGSAIISRVENQYDVANRIVRTSNPYAPATESAIFNVTTMDALGRPKLITPPSQGSQAIQYLGNKVTITDPTGKKRRNFSDALGRLTEVDEPGPHAASSGKGDVSITGAVQFQGGAPGTGSVTIQGGEQAVSDPDVQCPPSNPNCALIYDFGTVSITVNGLQKTVNYSRTSTATTVANGLRSAFNGDASSAVNAAGAGATITFTAKTNGAGTNYAMSISSATNNPDLFGGHSFAGAPSGPTLTGGVDGAVDSGTVSITVNSFTKTANYGSGSTPTSIASSLASLFNGDANSPVTAAANAGVVTLTSKTTGLNTNYSLSTNKTWDTAHFGGPSFTPSSASALAGGDDAGISIETPVTTVYTYNALDLLTQVVESDNAPASQNPSSQTRTYAYDSLGRLTSSTTPESGTVSFSYTDFSEVLTRTDARNVVTTYTYDPLNRIKTVAYNTAGTTAAATAGITYNYGTSAASNNLGRLQQMLDGSGSETYTYNAAGGITQVAKVIGSTTYNIGYTYNALGQLLTISYPSNRVVTQAYDNIGRLNTIASSGTTYLTINSANYNAAGQVKALTLGNGVAGTFTYNDHLQLSSLKYNKGTTELLNLAYKYAGPGGGNNGQIQGIDNNTGGTNKPAKSTTYTYDDWYRLSVAQTNNLTSAQTWKLTWDYDRYGNRKSQNLGGGTLAVTSPQLSISPATNRITTAGFTYDASGNLTNEAGPPAATYTYDAENRMVTATVSGTSSTYVYDANTLRVKRTVGGATRTVVYSGTKPIAEYLGTAIKREYIYAGSKMLVRFDISGATTTTTYTHPDHLSTRVETNTSGVAGRTFGHLPFGDIWYETGTADKWKFTTYERDAESGLDYAVFRYESSRLGRFMSPDPLSGRTDNPQSLNRYVYVLGDPINFSDQLGLGEFFESAGCVWEKVDFIIDSGNGPQDAGSEIFLIGCRPAVPPVEPLEGEGTGDGDEESAEESTERGLGGFQALAFSSCMEQANQENENRLANFKNTRDKRTLGQLATGAITTGISAGRTGIIVTSPAGPEVAVPAGIGAGFVGAVVGAGGAVLRAPVINVLAEYAYGQYLDFKAGSECALWSAQAAASAVTGR